MPNTPVWGNSETTQHNDQDLISVAGSGSVIEVKDVSAAKPAILAVNSNAGASARALKSDGKSEFLGGDVLLNGVSLNEASPAASLIVGDNSNEIHIGQLNHATKVLGNLQVTQPVVVGAGGANGIGNIEAQGTVQVPRPLEIGTGLVSATTSDITISRSGRTTNVNGALVVAQNSSLNGDVTMGGNATMVGALQVGPLEDAGTIDAHGLPNPMNLEIGGQNTTLDVLLGRVNQLVQLLTGLRMNGNRLILDEDGDAWIEFNPDGQVPGNPSLDLAPDGQVRFYIDVNGGHNVA